ncbi:MAG: hypothetical protein VXY94_10275 [Planctomycetota bacterium]|nr:hypothetical protein [Planctomycetota bacterium]MEC8734770.1 hypothetical protein [Planctomycetota bacterium]MEC9157914.1 hypothetical protein [Planctomycetota bacterium]
MTTPEPDPTTTPSVETVKVAGTPDRSEIPAPTSAPIIFAFGTTLVFAGLVTNPFVSIVGAVCVCKGVLGWWFDVLPRESMERIPVEQQDIIDTGPEPREVAKHLDPATPGRLVLPVEIPRVRSGVLGGLAGGVAMAAVAIVWGAINFSVWMPINLLAAMVLSSFNEAEASSLMQFNLAAFFVALGIHASVSILVGVVLAMIMPMAIGFPRIFSIIVAPLTWSLVTYTAMGVIDPLLEQWVDWWWFIGSQVAFGAVAGFFIARSERIETIQFLTPAERLGLEQTRAQGEGGES